MIQLAPHIEIFRENRFCAIYKSSNIKHEINSFSRVVPKILNLEKDNALNQIKSNPVLVNIIIERHLYIVIVKTLRFCSTLT